MAIYGTQSNDDEVDYKKEHVTDFERMSDYKTYAKVRLMDMQRKTLI